MSENKKSEVVEDNENKEQTLKPAFKHMDDMSMFLAWQNWCWMHYSWAIYQNSMMQAACHMQVVPGAAQHQQPVNIPPQPPSNQTNTKY